VNLELDLDSRTLVVLNDAQRDRDSVASRISGAILDFVSLHCGLTFHSAQLHAYVESRCGYIAPGSADRILRLLRQREKLNYTVVNRRQSLYRCGA
jgi:hypothetical protein